MKETVNHPSHYSSIPAVCEKCGEPIECISVVRHCDFDLGNALKYLWRSKYKENELEDLLKARWYIDDRIKQLEKEQETNQEQNKQFEDSVKRIIGRGLMPFAREDD